MDVSELVENARGEIWETVLLESRDGFVPPGVMEWSPGEAPIEYLEDGEQPHFVGLSFDRAVEVKGDKKSTLSEKCRAPVDNVKRTLMNEDIIGYISAVDPYSNILVVTNHRILLLVGRGEKDLEIEFRYSEDISIRFEAQKYSNVPTPIISADDIEYHLDFWSREDSGTYTYLRDECSITVNGHPEFGLDKKPRSETKNAKDVSITRLSSLLQLTPTEFEELIADLWRTMQYSCRTTKKTNDGGVDIVADDGNNRVLIQAKRYSNNNVGISTVQRTAGLLVDDGFDASNVVIVTTSGFTKGAKQRADKISNLRLINGEELLTLIRSVDTETRA